MTRWLLVVLSVANLWVAVTGGPAGPLGYPRSTAIVMVPFYVILYAVAWRRDYQDERPSWKLNLLLACIALAAVIAGLTV